MDKKTECTLEFCIVTYYNGRRLKKSDYENGGIDDGEEKYRLE
jgi:hypothetical protein